MSFYVICAHPKHCKILVNNQAEHVKVFCEVTDNSFYISFQYYVPIFLGKWNIWYIQKNINKLWHKIIKQILNIYFWNLTVSDLTDNIII